jgi:hypothetical protein
MSMAGMGLMGLTAGASTAGILGIVRLMGDHWLPRMASNSDHKHQMIASLQEQRHGTVQHWRAGLATARDTYREWAAGPRTADAPNAVGDEWFEGLRPHLPSTGEAAGFRNAHEIHCDNPTVAVLSLEIGRIEQRWIEKAESYPRRTRKSS